MNVLSWNIQWGRGADGRVSLERTIDILRQAGPLDAICLQEVASNVRGMPGGDCGDQVTQLAEAFPGWQAMFAPGVDVPDGTGGRARFGNLVLSRLPVDQVCRHILPMPADSSVPGMRRSCVEAVIESGYGPIRLLTTHLEYYSAVQRAAQISALRALQEEAAAFDQAPVSRRKDSNPIFTPRSRPVAAVLCGDFNFEPSSKHHEMMSAPASVAGAGWCDAWASVHGSRPHEPTVGLHKAEWPDRKYCCDYFWVSENLFDRISAMRVLADTDASDHQPVVIELDV